MRRRHVLIASGAALATALSPMAAADDDPAVQYDPEITRQGQPVTVSGEDLEANELYELRAVTESDDDVVTEGAFVKEVETDDAGTVEIETDHLDAGDHFLDGPNLPAQPSLSDTFGVVIQNLDVDLSISNKDDESDRLEVDLAIETNRGEHLLAISADELTREQLIDLFIDGTDLELVDEPDEETIEISTSDTQITTTVDEDTIDEGEYTFTFDVPDTTAEDTVSIVVGSNPAIQYDPVIVHRGQLVTVSGEDLEANEVYELRAVSESDDEVVTESAFVEDVEADDSGTVEIETDHLDNDSHFLDGPNLSAQPWLSDTFGVAVQEFDVDFEPQPSVDVSPSPHFAVTLQLDSNRGTYPVTVSADGDLGQEELIDLFVDGAGYELLEKFDNDAIEISVGTSESPVFTFDKETIDEGEYTFTFDVSDTEAEDTASVTVEYDTNETVETADLRDAIGDWRDDELSTDELRTVIDAWRGS